MPRIKLWRKLCVKASVKRKDVIFGVEVEQTWHAKLTFHDGTVEDWEFYFPIAASDLVNMTRDEIENI